MKRLKKVIRSGLPETNSSSSHSVIISKMAKTDEIDFLSLLPNEDGIIEIPKPVVDFGNTGFSSYNSPLVKLQLVLSLVATNAEDAVQLSKLLGWLKVLLCNFTGAKEVKFLGLKEFDCEYGFYEEYSYFWETAGSCFGSVDHQSRESLCNCIFEKNQVILDFIFNPDSWLFLGSDCYDTEALINSEIGEYYGLVEAYASIDFGYNLGRVDFPLYNYPKFEFLSDDVIHGRNNFILGVVFDPDSKKFFFMNGDKPDNKKLLSLGSSGGFFGYSNNDSIANTGDGYYLIFRSGFLMEKMEPQPTDMLSLSAFEDVTLWSYINANKDNLVEGVDYMIFKIDINIDDYNNVL